MKVIFLSTLALVGGAYRAEVLRPGHWDYPGIEGGLKIDRSLLEEFVSNFNAGVKGFEQPLNRDHDDAQPCGWVRALELTPLGSLAAHFDITDANTRTLVDEGTLRYVSAELDLGWFDPEHKQERRVFEGLALTNRPYIKRMGPVERVANLSEYAGDLARLNCEIHDDEGRLNGSQPGCNRKKRKTLGMKTAWKKPPTTMTAAEIRHPHPTPETLRGAAPSHRILHEETNMPSTGTQNTSTTESAATDVRPVDLEIRLAQESADKRRLEAELSDLRASQRATLARVRMSEWKDRTVRLARKGKITPPVSKRLLRVGQVLLAEGKSTIQLDKKVKFADDEAETDSVDMIDEILDMLEELPAGVSTDDDDKASLEEADPAAKGNMDDEIAKLAERLLAENPGLGRKAYLMADKQVRGKGRG